MSNFIKKLFGLKSEKDIYEEIFKIKYYNESNLYIISWFSAMAAIEEVWNDEIIRGTIGLKKSPISDLKNLKGEEFKKKYKKLLNSGKVGSLCGLLSLYLLAVLKDWYASYMPNELVSVLSLSNEAHYPSIATINSEYYSNIRSAKIFNCNAEERERRLVSSFCHIFNKTFNDGNSTEFLTNLQILKYEVRFRESFIVNIKQMPITAESCQYYAIYAPFIEL